MNNKLIGIVVCMLVMTATVISAAGIIIKNISDTTQIKNESIPNNRDGLVVVSHDEPDDPEPMAIKEGYLSIPAAAFIPASNSENYKNWGYRIEGTGPYTFVCRAPVYLPDEATVTELRFHWDDSHPTYDDYISLCVNYMTGWTQTMAVCQTSGSSGNPMMSFDNTIDYATIDNYQQSYYLDLLGCPDVNCYGVTILYTYSTSIEGSSDYLSENEGTNEEYTPNSD